MKNFKQLLILNILVSIALGILFFRLIDIPFGSLFNICFYFFLISILTLLFLLTLLSIKSSKIGFKVAAILPALLFIILTFVTVIISFDYRMFLARGPVHEPIPKEWIGDLYYLVTQMEKKHPGFKSEISKEEFYKIAKEIEANIHSMTDNEVAMEFYRLCAFLKDTHTFPLFPGINAHNFPLIIFRFEEGWYVIDAGRSYKELIGKRILKIGSADIEDIFKIHSKYISAESRTGRLNRFTYLALMPEWLETQGFIPDTKKGIFTFEDQNGEQFTKEIQPVKGLFYSYWKLFRTIDNSQSSVFENYRKENYKIEILKGNKILYIQCNAMSTAIADFAKRITEFTEKQSFEHCIIDLRNNTGGNDINDEKFVGAIKNNILINQRGKLFVLIGRYTLSAGVVLANKLQLQTKAIFIGEPSGQGSAFYANPDFVILPNSKMIILVSTTSTTRAQAIWPFETGTEITPDIEVKYTHKDYLVGKDPAIEAVINFKPTKFINNQISDKITDNITGRYVLSDFHIMEIKKDPLLSFIITDFIPESDYLVNSDLYLLKNGNFATDIYNVFVQLPTDTCLIGSDIYLNWMGQKKTLHRAPDNFIPAMEAILTDTEKGVESILSEREKYLKEFQNFENLLNKIGFQKLKQNKINDALMIFELNINLFPDSYNAYDSYGEALLENGDKEAAIMNYKKSLELNPTNENGKKVLTELGIDYSK
jgi:hypothetical protein